MRAIVVDDHPLIQAAVVDLLQRLDPDADVAVAGNCEKGLASAANGAEPDVVLLDLNLPGLKGIPALKTWRKRFPGVPVIILSAAWDRTTLMAALEGGAAGFIPKSSSNEVMENAVRLVLGGGKYIPPEILTRAEQQASCTPSTGSQGASADALGLTARQAEVLHLIAKGASNKIICRELNLAERTVKAHVTAILRALHVTSRTQAAIEASRLGLG